jgi:hypothetical protein
MSKEYNVDAIETETPKEECSSCKKGLNATAKWTIVLSIYMLFASIYGTIEFFKYLSSLF